MKSRGVELWLERERGCVAVSSHLFQRLVRGYLIGARHRRARVAFCRDGLLLASRRREAIHFRSCSSRFLPARRRRGAGAISYTTIPLAIELVARRSSYFLRAILNATPSSSLRSGSFISPRSS